MQLTGASCVGHVRHAMCCQAPRQSASRQLVHAGCASSSLADHGPHQCRFEYKVRGPDCAWNLPDLMHTSVRKHLDGLSLQEVSRGPV